MKKNKYFIGSCLILLGIIGLSGIGFARFVPPGGERGPIGLDPGNYYATSRSFSYGYGVGGTLSDTYDLGQGYYTVTPEYDWERYGFSYRVSYDLGLTFSFNQYSYDRVKFVYAEYDFPSGGAITFRVRYTDGSSVSRTLSRGLSWKTLTINLDTSKIVQYVDIVYHYYYYAFFNGREYLSWLHIDYLAMIVF